MAPGLLIPLLVLILAASPTVHALWQLPPLQEKRESPRAAAAGNLVAFAGGVKYASHALITLVCPSASWMHSQETDINGASAVGGTPSAAVDFYSAAQDRLTNGGLHLTMPFAMRSHVAAAMKAASGYLYFHFGTG